jgi:hypothetical protein
VQNEEEGLREIAIEELKREEANKVEAQREEEFESKYQARLAADLKKQEIEMAQAKEDAERRYKDRLKANMEKYGVRDIDEIVDGHPISSDKDLAPQEIKEKDRWYKNRVKAALLERRVPDGQIDEILNDTGDIMVIDGVRTTYTRMSRKWLSERTLKRYDVPFQVDKVCKLCRTHL